MKVVMSGVLLLSVSKCFLNGTSKCFEVKYSIGPGASGDLLLHLEALSPYHSKNISTPYSTTPIILTLPYHSLSRPYPTRPADPD